MKRKYFLTLCIGMIVFLHGFAAAGNSLIVSADTFLDALGSVQQEQFDEFLEKFTGSAAFQYSRIKFPLATPIILTTEDGEQEKSFPFTREKWPLLDKDIIREERLLDEHGGVYVSRYVLNEADHKEFEAGYEESELDLRLVFDRIEGEWFLTDAYTGWYGFDLIDTDLPEAVSAVQEENSVFIQIYP